MTDLLERAFAEASKLSPSEQDALAKRLLAELEDDQAWERAFARSQEQLGRLAQEALTEHEAGLTHELDPDKL